METEQVSIRETFFSLQIWIITNKGISQRIFAALHIFIKNKIWLKKFKLNIEMKEK